MAMQESMQPPPPFFIQTFSEQIERAYLRYRARSTLQRQYRQLLAGADPDSLPQLGRKRVRRSEEESSAEEATPTTTLNGHAQSEEEAATTTTALNATLQLGEGLPDRTAPHIDDVYRLDLSVAKPDAGILAIGDPPSDIYSSTSNATNASNLENRQIIQILLDKTWESDTLFYDLDGLSHEQIKALADVEWSRELPAPPPFCNSAGGKDLASSKQLHAAAQANRLKRKQQSSTTAMLEDERDLDEEIEHLKRSFCDKNRANSLAARGAAAW